LADGFDISLFDSYISQV